ncbi:MAG: DUF4239 domain-containing protein [Candidatus Omnitrophota bacterium]
MPLAQQLIFSIPSVILCVLIIIIAVVLSVGGTLLAHRFIPLRKLKVHNDIAGPIFGTLGVIYAVLLAFMVVVIWQKFDRANTNVEMEVNCLVNLYADAEPLEQAFKQNVRSSIINYTKTIINEWDILAKGDHSPEGHKAILKLVTLYSSYSPKTETEKIFFQEAVGKLNDLLDLRILRFLDARTGIHPLLWFVLIFAGVITIAFTIFFGSESLSAKILMSVLLAVVIALVLFIILEFSFPFTGSARISCEPFQKLIMYLGI